MQRELPPDSEDQVARHLVHLARRWFDIGLVQLCDHHMAVYAQQPRQLAADVEVQTAMRRMLRSQAQSRPAQAP